MYRKHYYLYLLLCSTLSPLFASSGEEIPFSIPKDGWEAPVLLCDGPTNSEQKITTTKPPPVEEMVEEEKEPSPSPIVSSMDNTLPDYSDWPTQQSPNLHSLHPQASLGHSAAPVRPRLPLNNDCIPLPKTLLEMQNTASPYEYAVLSKHVYQYKKAGDLEEGDVVEVANEAMGRHQLPDWQVFKLLQEEIEIPKDGLEILRNWVNEPLKTLTGSGYRGVLYYNEKKKQMVLAHQGTQSLADVETDILAITCNCISGQTTLVVGLLNQAVTLAKAKQCSLAVTGHSLGGWLAQITAFVAWHRYPDFAIKTVTFDTPGALPMLEKMNTTIEPIPLERLDITNYLSSPNLINACNPHIGSVYRVVFKPFSTTWGIYVKESHASDNFVLAFDPQTGQAKQLAYVTYWPLVSKELLKEAKSSFLEASPLTRIFAGFSIFKKAINKELLGAYSGFFEFATQTNSYHKDPCTLEGKDSFLLNYKYRYATTPCTMDQVHTRHLSRDLIRFLEGIEKQNPAHLHATEPYPLLCNLRWDRPSHKLSAEQADIHLVIDQLTSLAKSCPDLCKTTALVLDTSSDTLRFGNIPPRTHCFVPRTLLLNNLLQALAQKQGLLIAPPITGPGGIGKTQLARHLMEKAIEQHPYKRVVWIVAETPAQLDQAYRDLAEELHLPTNKPLKTLIGQVKNKLQNENNLYIFDDAPNHATIKAYLPSRGHILITSRNSTPNDWSRKPLVVDRFSQTEVLALCNQFFEQNNYKPDTQAENALQEQILQFPRYPLVCQHLLSSLINYPVGEWRGLLQKAEELHKLLEETPSESIGYHKEEAEAILTTIFPTTIEQLDKNAQALLQQLAYLHPQAIPFGLALALDKDTNVRAGLVALERCSFIRWERGNNTLYMHALFQKVVRQKLPLRSLEPLVESWQKYLGNPEESHRLRARWEAFLPHGRTLFDHLPKNDLALRYPLSNLLHKACGVACLFQAQLTWTQQSLSIAQERYPKQDHPDVAQSLNHVGRAYYDLGNAQKALRHCQQALQMRQRLYPKQDHPDLAHSLHNVGRAYDGLGDTQQALDHYKQALTMRQRLYKGQDHPDLATSLNNVGVAYQKLGDAQQALRHYKQALTMQQRLFPKQDHPDVALYLNNVGVAYDNLGDAQQALDHKKQALQMQQRLFPKQDHPDVAHSLNSVGCAYDNLGDAQQALRHYKQALTMQQRLFPKQDHPDVAHSLNSVGCAYDNLGDAQQALDHYKQALTMRQRLFPKQDHPDVAASLNNVGVAYQKLGDAQQALDHKKQALQMQQRLFPKQDHPDVALYLNNVGVAYDNLGDAQQALDHFQQAVRMAFACFQKEHPSLKLYLENLIGTLKGIGKNQATLAVQEELLPLCQVYLGEQHMLTLGLKKSLATSKIAVKQSQDNTCLIM